MPFVSQKIERLPCKEEERHSSLKSSALTNTAQAEQMFKQVAVTLVY
jgi:hypothetical protein